MYSTYYSEYVQCTLPSLCKDEDSGKVQKKYKKKLSDNKLFKFEDQEEQGPEEINCLETRTTTTKRTLA